MLSLLLLPNLNTPELRLAFNATVTNCYAMNTHSYQIIAYHSFFGVNYTNLHEVFSHRAKNQSRVVILHFNRQIQVVFMVTPRLLINILFMFSRKTFTLFEFLRCLSIVILFKFREKASNKKNSDHPFHN